MNHLDMVNHLVNHPEFMQHFRNLQALRMATPDQMHNFALHMAHQDIQPPDLNHMQQLADWHKGVMQQIPKESYLGFTPPKPPQPAQQNINIPGGAIKPPFQPAPPQINIPGGAIKPPMMPHIPQLNIPTQVNTSAQATPETFNITPRVS